MRRTIFIILLSSLILSAESDIRIGVKFMIGGRYDDMRMCVSSDRGTRGGMIADIMITADYSFDDRSSVSFQLPVMRPVLFAGAFKMLQFEPQFAYTYAKDDILFSPGLGLSFHFGPDYNSDLKNRGPAFFAWGPLLSMSVMKNTNMDENELYTGLKAFCVMLYSNESDLSPGTVLGLASESRFYP